MHAATPAQTCAQGHRERWNKLRAKHKRTVPKAESHMRQAAGRHALSANQQRCGRRARALAFAQAHRERPLDCKMPRMATHVVSWQQLEGLLTRAKNSCVSDLLTTNASCQDLLM